MCDTFVALANSTADGSVIFGKNSDRDGNEAHEIILIPRCYHADGENVHCTYIEIPQVAQTSAILLSKPFWIWGAEMGANEHGVVIGNEAIFSKVPAGKAPGLIGMDYLRLALERAASAREALEVIVSLLAVYGQSGNCGFTHPLYYHNSFLIADTQEAWVLETVDRHWAAQKVKDVRSISNGLTIEHDFDLASEDLVSFAVQKGWCRDEDGFSFKDCYSDVLMTFGSDAKKRQCRTSELLHENKGKMDVPIVMQILRDHGHKAGEDWSPDKGFLGAQICMHLGAGPVRISQTTGSMVSCIKNGKATHWLTGTSAPCTSIFKPVWLDAGLPDMGIEPTGTYEPRSLWWHHEDLHRAVLKDYAHRIGLYRAERDRLEEDFLANAENLSDAVGEARLKFSQGCFDRASTETAKWLETVRGADVVGGEALFHKMTWKSLDRQAVRK